MRRSTLSPVADAPIGIFDSGYGGLTVARAVLDQLPHEKIVYFGDTARTPYGPRPIAQTREFALECLDSLVARGVKALVIAAIPPPPRFCTTRGSGMTSPSSRSSVPRCVAPRPRPGTTGSGSSRRSAPTARGRMSTPSRQRRRSP